MAAPAPTAAAIRMSERRSIADFPFPGFVTAPLLAVLGYGAVSGS